MLHPPSRSIEVLGLVAGMLLFFDVGEARAQSCCAGGGAYAPARLALYEDALVGLQIRATGQFGSFNTRSKFSRTPPGIFELGLEQNVVGTLRVLSRAQVGLVVPVIETYRRVPGMSELGGGLGDIALSGRYDFVRPGEVKRLSNLALLVGVTAASGRPPERADTPLATGATGTGAWQVSLGGAAEHLIGSVVLGASFMLSQSLPRSVDGLREQLGLRMSGLLAGGYAFKNGSALTLTLNYAGAGSASINGETLPNSGQRQLTAGIAGGLPIAYPWRIQATLFSDLPLVGLNHIASVGGSMMLVRALF